MTDKEKLLNLDSTIASLREIRAELKKKIDKAPKDMMDELEDIVGDFLNRNEKAVITRIFVPAHKAEKWLVDRIEATKKDPEAGMFAGLTGVVLHNGGQFYATTWGGDSYRLLVEYP